MVSSVTHDLTVRLDQENEQLVFTATRRSISPGKASERSQAFTVEIPLQDLRNKNVADAERLIGSSVLGFFDNLAEGGLNLPTNYREN